jgi:hypothetical protein
VESDRERWSWSAIAIIGGALACACLFPAFEAAIEAGSGAGAAYAVSHRYEEEVNLAWDAGPLGVALLLTAVLVVAAALVARRGRARQWVAAVTLLVSVGLFAAQGFGTAGVTRWSDDATVYADQDAAPLIEAAVARLEARAEASPEARDPTWRRDGGEDRFGLRRRGGDALLVLSSFALFWIAGYRVARLWLSRWLAVLAVAVVTTAAIVWAIIELLDALEP